MTKPDKLIVDEWKDWTNEHLREFEQNLFDEITRGETDHYLHEEVLEEMRKRDLI